MKLLFIDVRKAHLNPACEGKEYIVLPHEAEAPPGFYGRLKRWLYGMRGAAQAWEECYTHELASVDFLEGTSSPAVFYNPSTEMRLVVHGDNFTFLGYGDDVEIMKTQIAGWLDIKIRGARRKQRQFQPLLSPTGHTIVSTQLTGKLVTICLEN